MTSVSTHVDNQSTIKWYRCRPGIAYLTVGNHGSEVTVFVDALGAARLSDAFAQIHMAIRAAEELAVAKM